MANVLDNEKKQQILALGQLGWSLRRIQQETRVSRETISTYLKAAGVGVWPPGGWGRQTVSKPAIGVTTGFGVELRGPRSENPSRNPSASACEPFQEAIDLGLSRGRNAMAIWRDLVSDYGSTSSYQSVKRYIHEGRGSELPQARAVILTAPGEEAQVDYGTGPMLRQLTQLVVTLACASVEWRGLIELAGKNAHGSPRFPSNREASDPS